MSALLQDLFASLNPANQQAILAKCTVYPSRTPARVVYQSAADADAHAEGFAMFPAVPSDVGYTPRMSGYFEAERRYQAAEEQRADERRERIARGD